MPTKALIISGVALLALALAHLSLYYLFLKKPEQKGSKERDEK